MGRYPSPASSPWAKSVRSAARTSSMATRPASFSSSSRHETRRAGSVERENGGQWNPAGFSRRGIDPVGETSNVPDTPLEGREKGTLIISTVREGKEPQGHARKRLEHAA